MASLLKTLKPNDNTGVGKTDGDKYNPDVANLYNETNAWWRQGWGFWFWKI